MLIQKKFLQYSCLIVKCRPTKYQVIKRWLLTFLAMVQQPPSGPGPLHYRGFTITLRHTTLGRNPLLNWSARSTDLYLTAHNTHKDTNIHPPPTGFELITPASDRPQTHALDRAATGICQEVTWRIWNVATWRTSCSPLTVNDHDQNPLHYSQVTALKPSRPSAAFKYLSKE